jgi:hypothetical protein
VLPGDFIGAFPVSTMTQDENFVGESFEVFSAKLLRSPHFLFSAVVNSREMNRGFAALLGGESFKVFSAKLTQGVKELHDFS